MEKLIAVLVLFVASCAPAYAASYIADLGNGNSVVATDGPCTSTKVLEVVRAARVEESVISQLHAAEARIDGKALEACYLSSPPMVQIVDETGDSGVIPMSAFRPLTNI